MSDKETVHSLKVVQFPKSDEGEDAQFPSTEQMEEMTGDGLESVIIIALRKNGHISHYIDGCSDMEAYGLMEVVKHTMITNGNCYYGD